MINRDDQKEKERIRSLKEYNILDTLPEEDLDAVVRLASKICETPIALISLIDEDRQWFKAKLGLDVPETPRNISFCQYAIREKDVYEIPDAEANPLFSANPFVTGSPDIRFYAGAPLTSPEGYNIGTLCVIDTKPKTLTEEQKDSLRTLSKFVISQFELRKAKEELEESRSHYYDLVERSTDVIYISSSSGTFTYISPAIEKLAGFTAEELLGKHFTELIAEEHKEKVSAFYLGQLNGKIPETRLEFPMITRWGTEKWVEQTVIMVLKDGNLDGFQGLVRDIDDRKQTEMALELALRQLREKDERFSRIFHKNPAAMVVFSMNDWKIIEANQSYVELSGYSEKELIELPFEQREIIPADDRRKILEEFQKKGLVKNMEVIVTDKQKNRKNVILSSHTVEIGGVKYGLSIMYDITEQKKLEAELKAKDAQFHAMFHSSPVAMSLGSIRPYKYLEVNESFSKLTGYSPDELKELDFESNGLIDAEGRKKLLEHYAAESYLRNVELKIHGKGEIIKYILLSTEQIDVNGEGLALSVYHDITKRKQLEEQLVIAKEQAEASGIAKEQFLANMSHEIRTPMNAVLGFTDLLSETKLSTSQKEYVNAIATSGKSLMTVINDILDYSKIEAGMLAIENRPISIRSIFSSLYVPFNAQVKKKKLKLIFKVDRKIPEVLSGDAARLTQIITNLTGNAIKFTSKGTITVQAVLKKKDKKKALVCFIVKDTGIGISQDKQKEIFERFNQGSNDTTRKYGGTGLGLSIVKKLAELQGGDVSVKSAAGKGSEFSVTIPYLISDAGDAGDKNSLRTVQKLKKKNVLILLVEDNRLNQRLADKILKGFGFRTEIAANGLIAVEKLRKKKYDLVLMDMQMPEMNGYEATKVIRGKLKNSIPIIAMTAHALSSEREKCLQLGMNGYISKPFKKEDLYDTIAEILGKEAEQEPGTKKKPAKKKKPKAMKELDIAFLENLADGDKNFIREVMEIFVEDVPDDLESIERAIAKKDFDTVRQFAHKLKSSLSLTGLEKVRPGLEELEALALKKKDLAVIPKTFGKIRAIFLSAVEDAKGLL
jgi:PAS domain S-box-containing protein